MCVLRDHLVFRDGILRLTAKPDSDSSVVYLRDHDSWLQRNHGILRLTAKT
jgi:hypothetical protein